jgi:osmotically inducible protein OsmC
MKLSFVLGEIGVTPERLETKCEITFEGGVIKKSNLIAKGTIPQLTKEKFEEAVKNAAQNCPISKALNTEISSQATLS